MTKICWYSWLEFKDFNQDCNACFVAVGGFVLVEIKNEMPADLEVLLIGQGSVFEGMWVVAFVLPLCPIVLASRVF